ncbi:hypothetical protein N0V82_009882 [Gnomoniopsis sp. IMI 355080]|nr:hypothetical protein N0V82_009882 [Gnomoniopsis sp. IMI 355080]
MASYPPPAQATEGLEQSFWACFRQIYRNSRTLLKELAKVSSPTEQELVSIRKISASLVAAIAAVHCDFLIFSSSLVAHLRNLEDSLPKYVDWLPHTLGGPSTAPDDSLSITKDDLTRLLTSILAEYPAHDSEKARAALFADFETLHGWYRRRELEYELCRLHAQADRKPTEHVPSSPQLGELIRELASLPKTLSLSSTPELRERLMAHEKAEEDWKKAKEVRWRMEEKEKAHRDALNVQQVIRVLDWDTVSGELVPVLQHAAARECFVQAQCSETSLRDRGLTTRAWNILRRFTFLDCSMPVAAALAPMMPPPSFQMTQYGVSLDFLMETSKKGNPRGASRNKNAIRELVNASLLTLHDQGQPTQRYTMTASTQLALRWRLAADSQEPVNKTESFCDRSLTGTAADIRVFCRSMTVKSGHNLWVLEALRHAYVVAEAPKTAWLKLGWYELYGSWQFVVKMVEECEAKTRRS